MSKQINQTENLQGMKLPPQDTNLEELVLGACLLGDKESVICLLELLSNDSFYDGRHQEIFKAIKQLYSENKPIDIATVINQLKSENRLKYIGGAAYISQLTNRVTGGEHIKFHALIIKQKHLQRQLIILCNKAMAAGYEDSIDVFDLIEETQKQLSDLVNLKQDNDIKLASEITKDKINLIDDVISGNSEPEIFSLPIKELNDVLNGVEPSEVVLIAARPSMGKTIVGLDFALHLAKQNTPTLFFSLETNEKKISNRLLANISGQSVSRISKNYTNTINFEERDSDLFRLKESSVLLNRLPLYINCAAEVSVQTIKNTLIKHKEKKIKTIVIDYLQLMQTHSERGKTREREVAEVSRGLKILAKEFNISIILLSQLNRQSETRGNKMPQLSDIRESGSIEQDCDKIIFLYRPEYYGLHEFEYEKKGVSHIVNAQGLLVFSIAKNKEGECKNILANIDLISQKIYDYETKPNLIHLAVSNSEQTITKLSPNTDFVKNFYETDKENLPF